MRSFRLQVTHRLPIRPVIWRYISCIIPESYVGKRQIKDGRAHCALCVWHCGVVRRRWNRIGLLEVDNALPNSTPRLMRRYWGIVLLPCCANPAGNTMVPYLRRLWVGRLRNTTARCLRRPVRCWRRAGAAMAATARSMSPPTMDATEELTAPGRIMARARRPPHWAPALTTRLCSVSAVARGLKVHTCRRKQCSAVSWVVQRRWIVSGQAGPHTWNPEP